MQNLSISYQIIQHNQQLQQICDIAQQHSVVALDTEFERIRSYYAKLGLIQLYYGETVALIDPLMISEWQPFCALLSNQNVLKVLHAGGEDIEIFHQQFGQLPQPVMDTQIAANFFGLPLSIGFAALVEHYLQLKLDKKMSRTDWLKRPLSERQLQYAAADVYYLLPVYQQMAAEMQHSCWATAINQECQLMVKKRCKAVSAENAYLDIGNTWRLNRAELNNLKFLAKWRLQEGIKRNIALNFIVSNEGLIQTAIHAPKQTSQLLELGLHPNEVRHHGKKLLWLLKKAKSVPAEKYPMLIENIAARPDYKKQMQLLEKTLTQLIKDQLPQQVVASKKSLHQLLKWYWSGQDPARLPELLQSWRQIYGEALLNRLRLSERTNVN